MNVYETHDLTALLAANSYPGRGIVLGNTADGKQSVAAYFIMGRSENSRNRIFVKEPDGLRTEAYDPAKLADPSLIIYHPVRQMTPGGAARRPPQPCPPPPPFHDSPGCS